MPSHHVIMTQFGVSKWSFLSKLSPTPTLGIEGLMYFGQFLGMWLPIRPPERSDQTSPERPQRADHFDASKQTSTTRRQT